MNWFYIALVAPALWSVTNHIDKYLISRYFKGGGVGSLLIFSSLIGFLVVPLILVFNPNVFRIDLLYALLIIGNGFIYILGLLPYIYALQKDEASIVVPLFQTIPVFSYFMALIFLGEGLTRLQMFASFLIIIGAIGISLDLSKRKIILKSEIFWLMFLSSFLVALNGFIFKLVAIQTDFWTTSFWEYIGFTLLAVILLAFVSSYRKQFLEVIRLNRVPVLGLNGLNEVLNIVAKLSLNFASLLAPLALAWVVNGFQPYIFFAYVLILTLFFPKLGKEDLSSNSIIQKVSFMALMFIGSLLIK